MLKFFDNMESYEKEITNNPKKLQTDIAINMPGIMNPIFTSRNIGVFDGFYDLMQIPIKYGFESDKIAYIAEAGKDKYIFLSTYFTEVYKRMGTSKSEREILFAYLHELMHERFKHLYKYKQFISMYPMPQIIYNIAFDIFINTLLKYFPKRYFSDCDLYKSSCRYYDSKKDLETNFTHLDSKFDLNITSKELSTYNILLDKNIESLSDNELVEVLYNLFKDFFDSYDKIAEKSIQQFFAQLSNESDSAENNSSNNGNANENNSQDSSSTSNKSNKQNQSSEEIKSLEDILEENIKNEVATNPKFKEDLKKYACNFSNLPSIDVDYGEEPDEPSVQEKSKMIKASQVAKTIIDNIKKERGDVPGYLRGFADIEQELPNYIELLQGFSSRFIGTDRGTYSPPNKKIGGSLIMPSFIDNEVSLLFIVDTSGSISDESVGRVISHVKAILDTLSSETTIYVAFNDVSYTLQEFTSSTIDNIKELLSSGISGGGGSDFTEVFTLDVIEQVDAVIFMSDFFIHFDKNISIEKPVIILQDKHTYQPTLEDFIKNCSTYISLPLYPELA